MNALTFAGSNARPMYANLISAASSLISKSSSKRASRPV